MDSCDQETNEGSSNSFVGMTASKKRYQRVPTNRHLRYYSCSVRERSSSRMPRPLCHAAAPYSNEPTNPLVTSSVVTVQPSPA